MNGIDPQPNLSPRYRKGAQLFLTINCSRQSSRRAPGTCANIPLRRSQPLFSPLFRCRTLTVHAETKHRIRAMMVAAVALNVAAVSLIVLHAVKFETAHADIPDSGNLRMRFAYDANVYATAGQYVEEFGVMVYGAKPASTTTIARDGRPR